ncbi:MAG: 3-hydroxyacyl-CoA dehydrogenase NAD-binding domain-containing protein [bacterium]
MKNITDKIKNTAIVGAGIMGGEIAYIFASNGFPVLLKDIAADCIDAGMERARSFFAFRVRRCRITQEEMDQKFSLITPTLVYDGFESADLILEAVTEKVEIKKKVITELDRLCPPSAIIASNTSALSVTEMAAVMGNPERFAGFHFFNPASLMRLVEVIRGDNTSEETIQNLCQFAERIGKVPVRVADSAGFIVNRLLCAAMIEAVRCEEESVASRQEIDKALVHPDVGLPVGLFKMADQLGIDLVLHVMETLHRAHGERFRPPDVLCRLAGGKNLGVKTGKGFYEYGVRSAEVTNYETRITGNPVAAVERIMTAVALEAMRVVKEGVASGEDVDTAMKFGALFKKPPFEYMSMVGSEAFSERLERFAEKHGDRFKL